MGQFLLRQIETVNDLNKRVIKIFLTTTFIQINQKRYLRKPPLIKRRICSILFSKMKRQLKIASKRRLKRMFKYRQLRPIISLFLSLLPQIQISKMERSLKIKETSKWIHHKSLKNKLGKESSGKTLQRSIKTHQCLPRFAQTRPKSLLNKFNRPIYDRKKG